ncbi:glycosyltransferase [Chitinophaga skermanii]|nr:glycosyltransferase family 2 protein [Chitinophaga skermanii]
MEKKATRLSWVLNAPRQQQRIALLIPQYNEASNCNLERRLQYFANVAEQYKDKLDVVIIDDGSTDNSLVKMIRFINEHNPAFYLATVKPNANKVGALYLALKHIEHEFVILSDFDTDIDDPGKVEGLVQAMQADPSLMGCYFRMLPYEGSGSVFDFQRLEYSLLRSLYRFHEKDQTVMVMPGAGCCFKRDVLLSIYEEHSGFRSGEDREATQIGHRLGFKAIYADHILTLTRPPLSLRALIKQRVRWNLGYIETFVKEKSFYADQIMKGTRIGFRSLVDLFVLLFILGMPLMIAYFAVMNVTQLMWFFGGLYVFCLAWCLNLLLIAPGETTELKGRRLSLILAYPVMKLTVDYFGWMGAIIKSLKKK